MNDNRGLIFDIQGHSVHDGPGCRTLIFLSGCHLRCEWCSNPEGMLPGPRLMYRESKCTCRPRRCIAACPQNAISTINTQNQGIITIIDRLKPTYNGQITGTGNTEETINKENNSINLNRLYCDRCHDQKCVKHCYNEALCVSGRYVTLEEIFTIIKRDRAYWGDGGGVTLGGGDPLFQSKFSEMILKACQKSYIHTAIETSAYAPTDSFLNLMQHVEWAFIDIKHIDPALHLKKTGVDNKLILSNIRTLQESGWNGILKIRMPVIPGYNDHEKNIKATASFLRENRINEINILPFHRLGESKYRSLGLKYNYADTHSPSTESLSDIKSIFQDMSIRCHIGHNTPF